MKIKKLFEARGLLTLLLCISTLSLSAQTITVRGTVTDRNNEPLTGATVVVEGSTSQGTVTDIDGNYTLAGVNSKASLEFSYVGMKVQKIAVNGQTTINVTLEEDSEVLGEVVVTALGMKRSQKALGYAMKEIKGDELNTTLINPVSALQGKVAGVEISGSDGGLFGSSKILIRGVSTLGKNNQPIYVVDGVILNNDIKEGNPDWDSNSGDYGNELKNLNPEDFETVSVLKGAAATALYGSRGMNGAIVITTKSGTSSKGLGIQFTQTLGADIVTSSPRLQSEFGNGTIAGYVGYGEKDASGNYYAFDSEHQFPRNTTKNNIPSLIPDQGLAWGPAFDGSQIEYYDGTMIPYRGISNRYKKAYQPGFNTNTNLAITGGNEKTTFYTSLSYKYADGIVPNNNFQRLSFMGKGSHKITDKIELEAGITFANSQPKNSPINIGENFVNGTWGASYDPTELKDKYKGEHGGLAESKYGDQYGVYPGRATWWNIYENNYMRKETSVRPSVKLNIDLTDWLRFNMEGSYNYYYVRAERKNPGSNYANEGGEYAIEQSVREQTNLNANILFNKTFGDWAFNGFIRGEYYNNFGQEQNMKTKEGLIVPNQYFIKNSKQTPEYNARILGTKRILSLAFQAGFSWKDLLFMDVTGRNDWASSLVYSDKHGNYSYFYPSVNASWLISNMFREELPDWISFAKVRGSWAQVGNDTDPYLVNTAYKLNTSTMANNNNYYGLKLSDSSYDQNLKPERKNAWEVGIDWRFFDNRIGIDATYYKENTYNQIMSIEVPGVSGIKNQLINAGNIENRGIELALNTVPFRNENWEWTLDFTWSKNMNKIISLHENVADYIRLSGDVSYGNYRIGSVAKVGSAYGLLLTDSELKYDKKSGLPILGWRDAQRTAHYLRNEAEIQEIGSMLPDFIGGISTGLTWKNWNVRVGLDMRFGGYVASYNSRYGTAYGFTENSLKGRPGHGGVEWTSKYDGIAYRDGVIPNGILPEGTKITQPDKSVYTVGKGGVSDAGESYEELIKKGVIEPTHVSGWTYRNNAWTMAGRNYGVVNEDWVKKLNYIALRDVMLSYRMPTNICSKLNAKSMNLIFAGHNLGYLLNTAPSGENPESVSGTSAAEFRIRSYTGVTSSFTFTVNIGF